MSSQSSSSFPNPTLFLCGDRLLVSEAREHVAQLERGDFPSPFASMTLNTWLNWLETSMAAKDEVAAVGASKMEESFGGFLFLHPLVIIWMADSKKIMIQLIVVDKIV
ncbi:hypothetical protein ACFX1X_014972 [Malus domestica]